MNPLQATIALTVPERLDKVVQQAFPQLSRRHVRKLIEQGSVYLNNRRIRRQSMVIPPAEQISLRVFDYDGGAIDRIAQQVKWPELILFQDKHLLVVNKPAGIPSAPTRESDRHHVYYYLVQQGLLSERYYPFHRLDIGTTGLLLIPLGRKAAASLNEQMKHRQIEKHYLAVVSGRDVQKQWSVKGFLSTYRGKAQPVKYSDQKKAGYRYSHTDFRLLLANSSVSLALIEALPFTGRTHQIRAHLRASGLTILGDSLYGSAKHPVFSNTRLALHCREMSFHHPHFKERVTLKAPLPGPLKIFIREHFKAYLTE